MGKRSSLPIIIVIASILLLVPLKDQLASILPFSLWDVGGISKGNLLLTLSWIIGALSLIGILTVEIRGGERLLRFIPWSIRTIAVLLTASVALLTYYFVKSDFSIMYVWQFSSLSLPLIYKISAVWAGQDGTFLLWAWCIFVYTWWISEIRGWGRPFVRKAQFVTLLVGMYFLTLTLMVSPFRTVYAFYPDLTPEFVATIDGNGLNPLLQDPWMAVHPPIVFIAYAAVTIPLSAALVYLFTGEREWEPFTRQWNRFAWLFLTLGIAIGGFWSYKVLGWGGYWAWDPVETSSFIPWLTLSGLMHASVQYRRKGAFKFFSPFLAVVTFFLVVYATFITRSGLWESVHAFAETTTGPWLAFAMVNLAYCSTVLGVDLYLREGKGITKASMASRNLIYAFFASQFFLISYKKLIEKGGEALPSLNQAFGVVVLTGIIFLALSIFRKKGEISEIKTEEVSEGREDGGEVEKIELITRGNLFYIAVVLFAVLAFVSFWGITYPMLLQAKTGVKVSVGVEFFNKWSHPFTDVLVLVMAFCLLFGRIKKDTLLKITGAVVVVTVVVIFLKPTKNLFIDSMGPILIFGGAGAVYRIADNLLSAKGLKNKARIASIYLIHLGVAFTLVGTLVSAVYDSEHSLVFSFPGDKGVEKDVSGGYGIEIEDLEVYQTVDGWWATVAEVGVHKDGKPQGKGKAESIDDKKHGRVTHVYIHRDPTSDVYVIFQGISSQVPGNIVVPLTVKVVPGISFLWLGIILLSVGILLLMLLDFEFRIPTLARAPEIEEKPEEVKAKEEEKEFLRRSLSELEASYREGKITRRAYRKLKQRYEEALEE